MAVDADLIYGTRLYYSTDNVTFTELADIKEIGEPGSNEAPDVDVTPLTPSAAFREFKAGLAVAGEVTFKQYFNKTRFTLLRSYLRTAMYWRIVFPDNDTPSLASRLTIPGFLKKVTTSAYGNPDDPITIDCTIKINGATTFTEGS